MGRRARAVAAAGFVAGAGLLSLGCPNPNTYGTPRTTPAGKLAHTVALEGISLRGDTTTTTISGSGTTTEKKEPYSATLPMAPTYQIRIGLADQVDLGFRIANLSSLGADLKWNFLKSSSFDMAIDPGMQAMYFSTTSNGTSQSIFIYYLHLPLLFGINVSEAVTFVPSGGLVYAGATNSASSGGQDAVISATSIAARGGLGIRLQTSKKFALFPEVNVMKLFSASEATIIVFGLGFNFGALPSYKEGADDDDDDKPKPKPATTSPPPPAADPPPASTPSAPIQ